MDPPAMHARPPAEQGEAAGGTRGCIGVGPQQPSDIVDVTLKKGLILAPCEIRSAGDYVNFTG
jgi:hypothetical protein